MLLISGLLLTIQACKNAESPQAALPDPQVKASSCLEDLNLQRLDRALEHCNAVVVSHPDNPSAPDRQVTDPHTDGAR